MQLTLFYDGLCPLCAAEMKSLRSRNGTGHLRFVDIQSAEFQRDYSHLDWQALNARIHAQWADGRWVSGLDATHAAWQLVGRGWLYGWMRWPLIRPIADRFYGWFARNRYTLSRWLTGKARLERCEVCDRDG
ncbi:DUF393 domain-containing protein [Aestuariibacter halophilus]|uniref:DUF393 domain-containing protein n=1 Tax=Fluctibacter halophilus TaxID=226011 RepID=A0ABS8GF96_9ALTE|nr:DUF393 domain-containing protein [Aestuariibacter halophilus]MCC2617866.1 DUF393 domain-containing protein [Aestuariibacter halophilus]